VTFLFAAVLVTRVSSGFRSLA